MASSDDSTLPPWQELQPFRSTFLRHLYDPETADAIRKTGAFLFAATLEQATFSEGPQGSEVEADLSAAAADLRYLEGYLFRVVAGAVKGLTLSPEDEALASRAGAWAASVGAVATAIEGALSP